MIEEIIKYLDGEMQGDSLKKFEERLANDENLKSETTAVRASKKISEGIIEAEIIGYLRDVKVKVNEDTKKGALLKNKNYYIIALTLAAACTLFYFFIKFNSKIEETRPAQDVYAMYYFEPIWPVERGGDEQILNLLLAKYLSGDKTVINNLLSSDISDKNYSEKRYWAAEILLKEKRYKEAISIAEEQMASKIHLSRLHYIKIMCLLAMDKKAEVKDYIQSLPKSDLEIDEVVFFEKLNKVH
jgi:hypothetical protein